MHTLYIILVITVALLIVVAYVALHPDKINNTRKGSGIELFDHGKQSFMEGLTELSFEAETDTKADTSASDDKIDSLITDFKQRIHDLNRDSE